MTGRVTDSTGATVPNCTVVIVQKGTNFTFTAKSNQEGIYRAPSLQPGQYRVTFESQGFKPSPWTQPCVSAKCPSRLK